MSAERLLAHYEKIADAPDAIARLRRFILDLAVRGKLLPQNEKDEPASELLKRIAKEKARLVAAGELRKPRDLVGSNELNEPFAIPVTWSWVRLDAIGAIIGGGTPSAADADNFAEPGEGVPWLTPADLGGYVDLYISRGSRDLSEKGTRASSATLMPKGTVLFTSRAPIGYVAIAANPISTNQGFKSIVPYVADCSRFIATAMKAFAPEIDAKAPGTTFKEVSGKIVAAIPFPVPPLAEQRRIVAKVDELMALCDRLEATRAEREATRGRLTETSLARLNAPDSETFQADSRFVLDALPPLTTRPDQIKVLRQTILNLAVRGKLVPQDASDESGSDLLKRIVKQKVSSRYGNVSINPEDEPYVLPETWKWAALDQLIVSGPQNGISPRPTKRDGAPKAITLTATTSGTFNPIYFKHVEANIPTGSDFWLEEGDLLFQRGNTREYVGMAAVYRGPPNTFLFPDLIIKVRVSEYVCLEFVHLASISPPARDFLTANASGAQATMPKINQTTLVSLPIPLPPLAEQRRIVAKVDALMALCDRLEASLAAAVDIRRRLLDALLAEAVAPADDRELEAAE
ncbi:restriction endonuclease subunit S [Bradyrhizobium sp. 151]|uniref:restriction endonuclease subunit S n=1 Tax=Bradyrhizobium sp. 151 TaxID=2782626 RepID=UPI001FF922CD|nr:restriction endonuclease subunit S [Bradyrhizobium sp. 151]MCK1658533.1 restriction endonuclease subunit S [Bradyrhizobium sp. 151]